MKIDFSKVQKILFTGDSITECGRDVCKKQDLGSGFVRLFSDMLAVREPEKNISIINTGIGGNTISHLLTRCYDDIIEHSPDVICILIGINDATCLADHSTSLHLAPHDFKKAYSELLSEISIHLPGSRVVLIPPFFLSRGQHKTNSYRFNFMQVLDNYVRAVNELACEYDAVLVPLSLSFSKIMKFKTSDTLSMSDRIHPNQTGHFAIAETIYNALRAENEYL